MAKKAAGTKMQTATAAPPKRARNGIAVRLDLPPADHERSSKIARDQGLSLASFARMALYRLVNNPLLKRRGLLHSPLSRLGLATLGDGLRGVPSLESGDSRLR